MELPKKIILPCGGFVSVKKLRCRRTIEAPLPLDQAFIDGLLDAGWYASLSSDMGVNHPTAFSPLCETCAREIYGDELVAVAKQHRRKVGTA